MQVEARRLSVPNPTTDKLVDLRVAHLNMIQGIISRMSGFSAGVKNFCVTISAAIIAVAYQKQVPMLVWAGAAVVLIFCIMDTYYLGLERRYRELYERVAARPFDQALDMSLKAERLNLSTCFLALRSISVAGFYVLLLIAFVTLLSLANHVQPEPAKATLVGDSGSARKGEKHVRETSSVASRAGLDRRKGQELSERARSVRNANTNTNSIGAPVRSR